MKCAKPIVISGKAFGCGQCTPCRVNRRRVWSHRLMLEAFLYSDNCFATLTYDSDNLPKDLSVNPKHTQDWMKRLRKSVEPHRIRFFLVGEYGSVSQRPHYHVALFGLPTCVYGRTVRRGNSSRPLWRSCCDNCRRIGSTWSFGDVDLGVLEPHSAQYICGYVTKKMTSPDDVRLNGRHPEFSRCSNRPGIGADFMHFVASELLKFDLDSSQEDVPSCLRHGTKLLPLGSYLQRKLREMVTGDTSVPEEVQVRIQEELSALRKNAFDSCLSFSFVLEEARKSYADKAEARLKIYSRRKL